MPVTTDRSTRGLPERLFRGGFVYFLLFAVLFVLYLLLSPYVALTGTSGEIASVARPYEGDARVRLAMALLLVLIAAAALLLALFRRMTAGKAVALIVLSGAVLRFGVMLYTPFYIHGHDVGLYDGYGHLDYIVRLYETWRLPDTNLGQFYHPPLAHLASAAAAKLYAVLTGEAGRDTIFEAARLAPCFFSCASMLVVFRLFCALDLPKRAALFGLAAVAFHPTFFLLSPSVNNDMAMVFFFLAAVLYTVRWYKDPSYKNILLLAVCIGCAMSAKFSGALAAVFTAAVFLLALLRRLRDGGGIRLVGQFAAFAAVCFPLGLWYQIRNLLLFGQPPGYVIEIPKTSALYVGDVPFAERFLTFDPGRVLWGGYCRPWEDFRLWEYTVRCAMFGEYTFSDRHAVLSVVLTAASLLLIVLSFAAMLLFLLGGKKKTRPAALGLAAVWLLLIASFVWFNIRYPFGCTMDFRYVVPTVVTGAAFLGLLFDKSAGSGRLRPLAIGMAAVLAVFAVSAAAFYII